MSSNICHICGRLMFTKDSLVRHGNAWIHKACGTPAPEVAFIAPASSDEALVAAIASMLADRVDEPEKLAREISQVLLSRFHITERKRT